MANSTNSRKRKLDRLEFLSDHILAFTKGIHTDVIVKPGCGGLGIPAHKATLAVKSKVFSYMLDSDECKSSVEKVITIPELSYEELEALLEFLYSWILSPANKHIQELYLAADKYDILYLQDLCRDQLSLSLDHSNVLDILELAAIPLDNILMDYAISFVVSYMEIILNSSRYKLFVRRNPDLSLDITKACVSSLKSKLRPFFE